MPERKGSESSPSTCVRGCCRSYSFPLAIPKSENQIVAEIARGVETVVCEARFGGNSVAAKNPRLSTTDDMNGFHTELQILGKLNHPNLATSIGARAFPPDYYFLYEPYEHGNLGDALHVSDWRQVTGISGWCVSAKALQYLHKEGVAHRDVKPVIILAHTVLEMNYSEQQLSSAVTSQDLRPVIAGSESITVVDLDRTMLALRPCKASVFDYVVESLHEITAKLFSEQKLADTSIGKPDVSISSNSDKNGLEAVLNYTREKRTDVNWASRTVEGLRSTVMEPSSPGWLNQASEDSSYLPGAVNGFICNQRSKTNNGGYVLL